MGLTTLMDCPGCRGTMRVPDELLGRKLRRLRCGNVLTTDAPTADGFEIVEDDQSEVPSTAPDPLPTPPMGTTTVRRKRRKKTKAAQFSRRLRFAIGGGILGGVALMALFIWGVSSAFELGPPPDSWQTFEVPNRFRVKLPPPGRPGQVVQDMMGLKVAAYHLSLDRDSVYAISYMEGELPPGRRSLPVDQLLNDSCDGAVANTPGGKEISRKSITLGPHAGKQVVIRVAEGRGKIIMRVYIHAINKRLFTVLAGGEGFEPRDKSVRWLFNSFEILDDGSPTPEKAPDPPKKDSTAPPKGATGVPAKKETGPRSKDATTPPSKA